MGFISLLKEALDELVRNPKLFLPKLVSVTLYIPPYLMLGRITVDIARNPAMATPAMFDQTTYIMIVLLALAPVWIFIDSMYPILVQQRIEKGRLDFNEAAQHVLGKFLKILAVSILISILLTAVNLPFIALISIGLVLKLLPLLAIGLLGALAVVFASAIFLYFVPTTLIIEKIGVVDAFKTGYALSRNNFGLVFWLTLASFVVLLLGFYVEGVFGRIGEIGFIVGRYLGGILTVYLYVINPTAYLEIRKSAPMEKPAERIKLAKKK